MAFVFIFEPNYVKSEMKRLLPTPAGLHLLSSLTTGQAGSSWCELRAQHLEGCRVSIPVLNAPLQIQSVAEWAGNYWTAAVVEGETNLFAPCCSPEGNSYAAAICFLGKSSCQWKYELPKNKQYVPLPPLFQDYFKGWKVNCIYLFIFHIFPRQGLKADTAKNP